MKRLDWKWAGVLVFLAGLAMWVGASSRFSLMNELKTKGLKARGEVIAGEQRKSQHVQLYYRIKGGKEKRTNLNVSKEFYERTGVGAEYDILYLPEEPDKIMIVGEPLATDNEYNIALIVTGVGAVWSAWIAYLLWKHGGDWDDD
jgi:hypothetical protein